VADGLRPRVDGDPTAGFDPGALTSPGPVTRFAVLGEALHPPEEPPTAVAHAYAAPGEVTYGPSVLVGTGASSGTATPRYLSTWFFGGRQDGVATRWDDAGADSGEVPRGPHPGGTLLAVGPDGRWTAVQLTGPAGHPDDPTGPTPVARAIHEAGSARAVAERVATGIAPLSDAELAARRDDVAAALSAEPLVASFELEAGTLTVHGADGRPEVACLRVGGELGCRTSFLTAGMGPATDGSFDGLRVGGVRYTAVVTSRGAPVAVGVDPEAGEDGPWRALLGRSTPEAAPVTAEP
jgi:hypothetical protein